jgi:hypothetical protein
MRHQTARVRFATTKKRRVHDACGLFGAKLLKLRLAMLNNDDRSFPAYKQSCLP